MKLVSYSVDGRPTYGAVVGEAVVEIPPLRPGLPATLKGALRLGVEAIAEALAGAADAGGPAFDDLDLLPVVPDPGKVICAGVNYADHRSETGRQQADYPTLFVRFADSQVGHEHPVAVPDVSTALDYEGELAVVIGEPAYKVPAGEALTHVAGYACFDDFTVRDFQRHSSQFTPGKNFIGVGSFGPWLVTADEIADVEALHLETRVNGETRQSAQVSDMIFSIPELIAYVTTFTRLDTGDVVVTGTPGGVGFFRDPPLLLRSGDVVEVEIDHVGLLRTPIA